MQVVFYALNAIGGLGSLVCFIMVCVAMMKHGQTALGIVCLIICCPGALVAYIFGWVKSGEWQLKNIMLIWTICIIIGAIGGGGLRATMPVDGGIPAFPGR